MKLEEIRALLEKVTPGPWETEKPFDTPDGPMANVVRGKDSIAPVYWDYEEASVDLHNARFIALSRSLVPLLLDIAEAANFLLFKASNNCTCIDADNWCSRCVEVRSKLGDTLSRLEETK